MVMRGLAPTLATSGHARLLASRDDVSSGFSTLLLTSALSVLFICLFVGWLGIFLVQYFFIPVDLQKTTDR